MTLIVLEEAIQPIYEQMRKLEFCDFLKFARDAIGLKLYRAAEFIGVAPARLKNLETGYFRVMPTEAEIEAIARLYDVKAFQLKSMAKDHVLRRQRAKKIRTMNANL